MPKPLPAMEFLRDPARVPEAPIYAVFGPEDYLRRRCLGALLEALKSRGFEPRRVELDDTIAPVLDELRSPGMFGDASALVVSNRRVGNRQEATTRFKEQFLAYLEKPSSRNVLVFDAATWQRNLAVPKRVSADYPSVICEELKPWDARGFGAALAPVMGELGLKAAPDAIEALRDYTGGNLGRADMELRKLALLASDGRVTVPLVARGCGYEGGDVTFSLCDAILTGESVQARRHAAKLAGKAELGSVLSLFALLRMQVAGLGRASLALQGGASGSEAVSRSRVRLRDQYRPGFLKTARALDREPLRQAIEVLMAADEEMKSASPDPGSLMVATVAKLCEVLHRGGGNREFRS